MKYTVLPHSILPKVFPLHSLLTHNKKNILAVGYKELIIINRSIFYLPISNISLLHDLVAGELQKLSLAFPR